MRTFLSAMAIGLLMTGVAAAADCCEPACCDPACCEQSHGCCDGCGSNKVCKVVCEMKQIKKTVWAVECEEFCAPLPGCGRACKLCCNGGECGDAGCGSCCEDPCASLKRPMVAPKCGNVRCRKRLVKKEIVCDVPVYKCIVVCCDPACGGCVEDEVIPEEAPDAPAQATENAPLPPAITGIRHNR